MGGKKAAEEDAGAAGDSGCSGRAITRARLAAAVDQHAVWERIAHAFDATRDRPWPVVVDFVRSLPPRRRVLDLMAGNGRHAAVAESAGHDAVWSDWSRPAARIASGRLRGPVVVSDARVLPFVDDSFDAVLYVAGLHGIPEPEGRLRSLRELRRVLRPGGRALVTVWSREAPRFCDRGTPGQPLDAVVPWRAGGVSGERTYHLHTRDSLRAELETAGLRVERLEGVTVASAEADNWVAVLI